MRSSDYGTTDQAMCSYHPNRVAVDKCERCNRLICIEDKMVYRDARYRANNYQYRYRYDTPYTFCPVCYYETVKQQNVGSGAVFVKIASICFLSFFILLFFSIFSIIFQIPEISNLPSGFNTFFSIFPLVFVAIPGIIIIGLIISLIRSPRRARDASSEQEAFLNHLNGRSPFDRENVMCNQCGSLLTRADRFCPTCGDSTKDEFMQ